MNRILLSVFLLAVPFVDAVDASPPDSSVEAVRASIQIAVPGLIIEPVVVEPDVVDPVDVTWDDAGRMYVAEMRDYPDGVSGGTIRRIEDTDWDGAYDRSTVFAEGLPFPNSVLPWNDGLLVCAAPDILYLNDVDGDGRSDLRETVLTGFSEGNQQLRINGLFWGLDGWVYAANGRSSGAVRGPSDPPENAVQLGRRDLRFRPGEGRFEPIAGFSQFGICMDDWGNRFLSWNTNPIRHVVLEESVLGRSPYLMGELGVADIADSTDGGRLFPRLPVQHRFNSETVEFWNASCGTTVYRGAAIPRIAGDAFICEPLTSLIHRRRLERNGSTFTAKRVEQGGEFLSASNLWFRPVNLETGPDGALYIVDFCREWVEHPDFVPAELRGSVDWRVGDRLGRIWRVRPQGDFPPPAPREDLGAFPSSQLVRLLDHPNSWHRDRAQRELIEREDRGVLENVAYLATGAELPQGRIHALSLLEAWGEVSETILERALDDPAPELRAWALSYSERQKHVPSVALARADERARDPVASVRMRAACLAGRLPAETREGVLLTAVNAGSMDEWLQRAVLSAVGDEPWPFLRALLGQPPNPSAAPIIRRLASEINLVDQPETRDEVYQVILDRSGALAEGDLALLGGLLSQQENSPELILGPEGDSGDESLRTQIWEFAAGVLRDDARPLDARIDALGVVAEAPAAEAEASILETVLGDEPLELKNAAVLEVVESRNGPLARRLLEEWPQLAVSTRKTVIARFSSSPEHAPLLLHALSEGWVAPTEIDPSARELLLRISGSNAEPQGSLFSNSVSSDRDSVVAAYRSALDQEGDVDRGAAHMAQNCLACHIVQGIGNRVGPDLSGAVSRTKEKLLADILNPSAEVAPDYVNYIAETHDGEMFSGVLAGETREFISLKQSGGWTETIHREDIAAFRASTTSVMPEGLESVLDIQAVADILEFLARPRRDVLEREWIGVGTPGSPPQK